MKKILMDRFAGRAKELGYHVREYSADRRVYEISKNGKKILTLSKHFPLNSIVGHELTRRKDLTKQILAANGIPTPKGILTNKWDDVLRAIKGKKFSFPLVAKPDTSSLGKYVSANIEDVKELRVAFDRIRKVFGNVLIEEHVKGEDYRFLVLDGEVIAVARRTLPFVVGDGKSTIIQLIKKYNSKKVEPLILGHEVERVLGKQKLSLESVPAKGREVILRRNANAHTGGGVENVSKGIDPKFFDIAIKATALLGLRFCGVDIISENIEDTKRGFSVVELNSDPGYDLHLEVENGGQFDATERILKSLFSGVKEQK